jgi:sterol desaturase/sphingolipid hydroxylase (fatty acid hydroxylase superfamily)
MSTALNILCNVSFSLLYLPGYLGVKAYKEYEIEPNLKKPWEREGWPAQKKRTIWNLLLNFGVIAPLYVAFGLFLADVDMKFEGFPSHAEIVKQTAIILVVDDFLYMCLHRIFHEVPFLYRYHKVHHEYDSVFSMLGQYAHPVEEVLGNLVRIH